MNSEPNSPSPSTVRVFSKRLNAEIEVPLEAQNPDEDQLAGVMPVMIVTDHPLVEIS